MRGFVEYPAPRMSECVAYEGRGTCSLGDARLGECRVRFECYEAGHVVCWFLEAGPRLRLGLWGEQPVELAGVLEDGRPFACEGVRLGMWPDESQCDRVATLVQRLRIGRDCGDGGTTFVLTNLLLPTLEAMRGAGRATGKIDDAEVILEPLGDYQRRMVWLRSAKGTAVTCLMTIRGGSRENEASLAEDLSLLLSVATGNRVNWVARETDGETVFENRVTKPCSGWPVRGRGEKVFGRGWGWAELLGAALRAVPSFRKRAEVFRLREGIVSAWIDARLSGDHLEGRGLKTVVVLEMVANDILTWKGDTEGSFPKGLKGAYREARIRRRHFDRLLELRNGLVHEMRFRVSGGRTAVEEYEMLVEETDRLVLALCGYGSGSAAEA